MSGLSNGLITKTIKAVEKETRLWDDNPKGLGLRIKANGTATFFIQYKSPDTFKKVRTSIGQYGKITLDGARTKARKLFGEIADDIDPVAARLEKEKAASRAIKFSDFCDWYMKDAESGHVTYRGRAKKPSTLSTDRGRVERHLKPLLGGLSIDKITKRDVTNAMHQIRLGATAVDIKTRHRGRSIVKGGAGTAARTIRLLGSIFTYAIKLELRDDNPVRGIELPKDNTRERILSPEEFQRLGAAMQNAVEEGQNPVAIRAYIALALTGCRKSEIFALKRSEVDAYHHCLRFTDTKTGAQVRPIGNAAVEALQKQIQQSNSEYVFPASRGDKHFTDPKMFNRLCKAADLDGITLHTLRHSFASVALELEFSEMTVASLLGHRIHSITKRYAHHVDKALVTAADRIASAISQRLSLRIEL
ncbi:MAG: tyrosine-type recombinase/integrase [Kordiimonadaceae bacterium]|nr:tyrosine-type recombinase/integrase [Kordiimonadaceae bacterium]